MSMNFKRAEIVASEADIIVKSAMYLIPEPNNKFRIVVVDDAGNKRYLSGSGLDGKSAYEVAVQNGYIGTETEWLVSLEGQPGDTATIQIGLVESLPSSQLPIITNTGTDNAAIFNFGIPKGEQGPKGDDYEAIYNNINETPALDIIKRVDLSTGVDVNYRQTTYWVDGSQMDDTKVDGVIYTKKGNTYYRREFEGNIYPEWFGAKGDGVTDDSLAIQKAIDMAKILSGGTVIISKKTYAVGTALMLKETVTLKGLTEVTAYTEPIKGVLKALPSLGENPILKLGNGSSDRRNMSVVSVGFDCNNIADVGIYTSDVIFTFIKGCWFLNGIFGGAGIRGGGCLYLYIEACTFTTSENTFAIDLLESYKIDQGHFYGVNVGHLKDSNINCAYGVRVEGIFNINENDFELFLKGTAVIDVPSVSSVSCINIIDNYFELGKVQGIPLKAISLKGVSGSTITGNTIYGSPDLSGSYGVYCEGCYSINVTGNRFTRFDKAVSIDRYQYNADSGKGVYNNFIGTNFYNFVNTEIQYPQVYNFLNLPDENNRMASSYYQKSQSHNFVNSIIFEECLYTYGGVTWLNLNRSNYIHLDDINPVIITDVRNKIAGNSFYLSAANSGVITLPNSIFNNKSGTDIVMQTNEVRHYIVIHGGIIREL